MAWLATSLRRLRDERSTTIALVVLIFVTALVFASAPRLFERIGDDALHAQVGEATSFDRDLQLIQVRRIASHRDDPMGEVEATGAQLQGQLPASVQALVQSRDAVADSLRWSVRSATPDPSFVRLRVQQDVDQHIAYTQGRAPTGNIRRIPNPFSAPDAPTQMVVFEVGLSEASATAIATQVGAILPLSPDPSDVLVGRGGGPDFVVAAEVVGVYDVPDRADPYWMDDTALIQPGYRSPTLLARLVDVHAVLAPDAYPDLLGETMAFGYPVRYTWRYRVDPDRLTAANAPAVLVDLRRLESTFPASNAGPTGTTLRSGLLPLIERWTDRWASASTLLGVIAIGPIVVALSAVAMVVLLAVARRRPSLELSRGRGASTSQVLGSASAEALFLTVPAVALALVIATAAMPAGSSGPSVLAAGFIAFTTILLIVLAVVPTAVASPRGPGRGATAVRGPSARRLVLEGLVVVLAVAGAWILRERGTASQASVGGGPVGDPLIAAVPALAGLAAGLILVRLLPYPIRALGRLASLRRDLVPVLAMRRAASGGGAGAVLLVLMAAAAIAAFSLSTLLHFSHAADDVAWEQVGAPYHLGGGVVALPSDVDPATFPEVEASAGVFSVRSTLETRRLPLSLVALDVADLGAVVAGTPADPGLPDQLLAPAVSPGSPYPAIVSQELATGTQALAIGDTFMLPVEARVMAFQVIEVRDRYPGLREGEPFVIVSRDQVRADRKDAFRTDFAFYIRADDSPATAAAIRAEVRPSAPFAVLDSRAEHSAALRSSPIIDAIVLGVAMAGILAALYAALAISAALALAGTAQAVEVAHLRTMGMTRREAFGLVIVEHGPVAVIGFAAGVAFGYALFQVVRPGLGLDTLVGSSLFIPVVLGLDQILAISLFIVAIAALGIGLGAFLQRRAIPASAIRRGFE